MIIVGSVMAVIVLVAIVGGIAFTYWEQRHNSVDPTTVTLSITDSKGKSPGVDGLHGEVDDKDFPAQGWEGHYRRALDGVRYPMVVVDDL